MKINCLVNGEHISMAAPADRRVVDLLREDLGLTGTKEGCGTGECGACTILVDGQPRLSCLTLAAQLEGRQVTTIEGLARAGESLHPVQQSFVEHGAVQCGFCTPGMVLTAAELLTRKPQPDRQEAAEAISGNLCRCTGYRKILDAIEDVTSDLTQQENITSPKQLRLEQNAPLGQLKEQRQIFNPQSLEELWPLLDRFPDAKILAGGTDLLVGLRNRKIEAPGLIRLDGLKALCRIEETSEEIRIGAACTHADLLTSPLIGRLFPVLVSAIKTLGSPHIRRIGTIGGNIVTASPAGDCLPPLLALDAEVELTSAGETRRLPLSAFLLGPGKTALRPGEIVTAVFLPRPTEGTLQHFEKVGLRSAMACAIASLAAIIRLSPDTGRIESARLAWGSVAPTAVRLAEVEEALIGLTLDRESLERIVPLVHKQLFPITDVRATADYRLQVAGNLVLRLSQYGRSTSNPLGAAKNEAKS